VRRTFAVGLIMLTLLSGCAVDSESVRIGALPLCDHPNTGRLLLMAQSVPSASLIPCIEQLPEGWQLEHVDVESGQSRLQFDNPVGDDVRLFLLPGCSPAGSPMAAGNGVDTYVTTDGSLRIDEHVFDGGCIRLEVPASGDAVRMADAIGWVTRDWLRQESDWEL